jgi:hypothetical protein
LGQANGTADDYLARNREINALLQPNP